MLFHSKKAFLLPSVWPGRRYIWEIIWKKSLLICSESYQGVPYFHTDRVDRNMSTLLVVYTNPISKRWFRGQIIYVIYSFLSYVGKKNRNLACISGKQVIHSKAVIKKCSLKNCVLRKFAKFTAKYLCHSL